MISVKISRLSALLKVFSSDFSKQKCRLMKLKAKILAELLVFVNNISKFFSRKSINVWIFWKRDLRRKFLDLKNFPLNGIFSEDHFANFQNFSFTEIILNGYMSGVTFYIYYCSILLLWHPQSKNRGYIYRVSGFYLFPRKTHWVAVILKMMMWMQN